DLSSPNRSALPRPSSDATPMKALEGRRAPAMRAIEDQRPRLRALEDQRPLPARALQDLRGPARPALPGPRSDATPMKALEGPAVRGALEGVRGSTPPELFGKRAEPGLTAQYPGASVLPENYPAYDAYRGGTVTTTTTTEKIKGVKATVQNEHVDGGE